MFIGDLATRGRQISGKLTFMELGLFSSRLLMMARTFFDNGLSRTGRTD